MQDDTAVDSHIKTAVRASDGLTEAYVRCIRKGAAGLQRGAVKMQGAVRSQRWGTNANKKVR